MTNYYIQGRVIWPLPLTPVFEDTIMEEGNVATTTPPWFLPLWGKIKGPPIKLWNYYLHSFLNPTFDLLISWSLKDKVIIFLNDLSSSWISLYYYWSLYMGMTVLDCDNCEILWPMIESRINLEYRYWLTLECCFFPFCMPLDAWGNLVWLWSIPLKHVLMIICHAWSYFFNGLFPSLFLHWLDFI